MSVVECVGQCGPAVLQNVEQATVAVVYAAVSLAVCWKVWGVGPP